MTISMIGIDHDRAPVDIRALFAFTKKNAGEAMENSKRQQESMAVSYFQPAIVLKFGQATKTTRNFLFTSVFASLKIYRMILMNLILFQEQTVRLQNIFFIWQED